MANKLKKDDEVVVLVGKDKGKKGRILSVDFKKNIVLVEGVNIVKKHQKPTQQAKGDIIDKPMPVHRSNVKLICPIGKKPTKVTVEVLNGKRRRKSKLSNEFI